LADQWASPLGRTKNRELEKRRKTNSGKTRLENEKISMLRRQSIPPTVPNEHLRIFFFSFFLDRTAQNAQHVKMNENEWKREDEVELAEEVYTKR
jgi:hypothetical protein